MKPSEYSKKFKSAKTQQERDMINRKFEKSIHRHNLIKKFFNAFKETLPILDFIIAVLALIVALVK